MAKELRAVNSEIIALLEAGRLAEKRLEQIRQENERIRINRKPVQVLDEDDRPLEFQTQGRPAMIPSKLNLVSKPKVQLAKLPGNWAIDTKTGALINLDGSKAHVLPTKEENAPRQEKESKRFPAGIAILFGCDKNGKAFQQTFSVGGFCKDPYQKAFQVGREVWSAGGRVWIKYRRAGYEIQAGEHGNTYLVPSGPKGGQNGDKAIEIVDPWGRYPTDQERIELQWWTDKIAQLPKIKLDSEEKAALKTGQAFDLSAGESLLGHPFRIRLQDGSTKILRGKVEPENYRNHAELLAREAWGDMAPQWVEYVDEAGEKVRVFRGESLAKHTQEEDEGIAQLRDGYDSEEDPEEYAQDLVQVMTPWARDQVDRVEYLDHWKEAHEKAAMALESDDPVELVKAKEERRKLGVKEIPGYGGRVQVTRQAGCGYHAHKWHGKAKNSKHGATWDRMMRAQAWAAFARV
ncbi:MAG: hypothetical protein L0Y56_00680 [Nitrospira sp.]|nr:hypothetical protein [Nitrospira sp.]